MKRRPVLLSLALISVALLVGDVKSIAQLLEADGTGSTIAVRSDSPIPLAAIRLVDGAAGTQTEVVRHGKPLRGSVATPFTGLHLPLNVACAGAAPDSAWNSPACSSLVSWHTRLQI